MSLLISSERLVKSDNTEVIKLILVASETVKFETNEDNFSLTFDLSLRSLS